MRLFRRKTTETQSAAAHITRGDVARDCHDWDSAIDAYRSALDKEPELVGIRVQYAHALKEAGQVEEAVKAYQEAATKEPDNADTYIHLAHALKQLGRREEAIDAFEHVIALDHADKASLEELRILQMPIQGASINRTTPQTPDSDPEILIKAEAQHQEVLKELKEVVAASSARLAAFQTLNNELRNENDVLKDQIQGQQIELNKQQTSLDELKATVHDALRLRALLDDALVAEDTLKKECEDLRADLEKRDEELRGHEARMNLAREEFLRSEGQIELIKDLVLREGGL